MSKSNLVNITTQNNRIILKPIPDIVIRKKDRIVIQSDKASREDVIYNSQPGDFLGNTNRVCIINSLNLLTNSSRTIAQYTSELNEVIYEKNSDRVAALIGQKNYDTVFSALCSVINHELKIKGILALLTQGEKIEIERNFEEKSSQTDESCINIFKPIQPRRRKCPIAPYVVKDPKRIVLDPQNAEVMKVVRKTSKKQKTEEKTNLNLNKDVAQQIASVQNKSVDNLPSTSETSPNSIEERIHPEPTTITNTTITINQPLNINSTRIQMLDGSQILVPYKPQDHFHIATPDILANVMKEERMKLLTYQAYIDWKFCLIQDEDENYPIHMAVQNNDIDLVRRQCIMLRTRNTSVDILASNMTALQMSLFQSSAACTSVLLSYGADPLYADEEQRTLVHLASEVAGDHLRVLLEHCERNARQILQANVDLWRDEFQHETDEWLARYLLDYIATSNDNQGYTPLMVACKAGLPPHASLLLRASPASVDTRAPNSGNTALYLAVGEAAHDCAERGNKSKLSPNFRETIQLLIQNGADPSITNHSGTSANELVSELNMNELSQLVTRQTLGKQGKDIWQNFYDNMSVEENSDVTQKIGNKIVKTEPKTEDSSIEQTGYITKALKKDSKECPYIIIKKKINIDNVQTIDNKIIPQVTVGSNKFTVDRKKYIMKPRPVDSVRMRASTSKIANNTQILVTKSEDDVPVNVFRLKRKLKEEPVSPKKKALGNT